MPTPVTAAALAELDGLRGLARALAKDDADDLVQEAALAALTHPPAADRPLAPWLATVLRNRWRMDRRAAARRRAREDAAPVADPPAAPDQILARARTLALPELFDVPDKPSWFMRPRESPASTWSRSTSRSAPRSSAASSTATPPRPSPPSWACPPAPCAGASRPASSACARRSIATRRARRGAWR